MYFENFIDSYQSQPKRQEINAKQAINYSLFH